MRRQSLFQFIDALLFFVAVILLASGVYGMSSNFSIGLILISTSIILIVYYILTLRVRLVINKYIDQEERAEETLEIQGIRLIKILLSPRVSC